MRNRIENDEHIKVDYDIQQTQHIPHMSTNRGYRTLSDYRNPPMEATPPFIVPPSEDFVVEPYLLTQLPNYHGYKDENPYTHISDLRLLFIQRHGASFERVWVALFPLTLKDRAKHWMISYDSRVYIHGQNFKHNS